MLTVPLVTRSLGAARALVASLLFASAGCDRAEGVPATQAEAAAAGRAEEPPPAAPPAPAPPASSADTPGETPQPPGCLVETPVEPPAPASPASDCPVAPQPAPELARGEVRFPEAPGAPRVGVEIAAQPAEQARGLMYRTSMPEDQGMLFRWGDERVRSFWMRNTCIPLDMLFLSRDGTVVGIHEQVPVLNDRARSIPCPAAYVLEVNAGWCRRHGVRAGMRAVIE